MCENEWSWNLSWENLWVILITIYCKWHWFGCNVTRIFSEESKYCEGQVWQWRNQEEIIYGWSDPKADTQVNIAANRSPGQTGRSSKTASLIALKETTINLLKNIIARAADYLQKGLSNVQSTVKRKLEKIQNEFIKSIDEKFKAMKSDIDLELSIQKHELTHFHSRLPLLWDD